MNLLVYSCVRRSLVMPTSSRASPASILQDVGLLKSSYELLLSEPFWLIMQQGGSFGGEICVSWLHVPQCDLSDSMPRKPLALRHVGLPQSIGLVEILSDHPVHIEVRSVDGNRSRMSLIIRSHSLRKQCTTFGSSMACPLPTRRLSYSVPDHEHRTISIRLTSW